MQLIALVIALQAGIPAPMPEEAPDEALQAGADYWKVIESPPEGDWLRFPGHDATQQAMRFNRRFREHLCNELEVYQSGAQQQVIAEAAHEAQTLYRAWDVLDDAQQGWRANWSRRLKLRELRELSGE